MSKLNLQNPFQARRWLRLIEEDSETGFLLRKCHVAQQSELGFSFESNPLGLRGPSNTTAPNVIFGTSFAMGIAVDNGDNWYEHAVDDRSWLNLGLPVGFKEWSALEDRYHAGCKTLAIILYHPNIWIHCEMYRRWRESGLGVFSALNWQTSLSKCTHIYIRRLLNKRRLLRNGSWIEFTQNSHRYQIDANYARIHDSEIDTVFWKHIATLASITRRFRSVMIVRLPIKQELLPEEARTKPLVSLVSQYDRFWNLTKKHFQDWPSVSFYHPACFSLSHFHTDDSHWNVEGNLAFGNWLKNQLERLSIVNSQPK